MEILQSLHPLKFLNRNLKGSATRLKELAGLNMNICIVCDSYPGLDQYGGIAVYTKRLSDALVKRGHDVHVLVASSSGIRAQDYLKDLVHVHVRVVHYLPFLGGVLCGLGESMGAMVFFYKLHLKYKFDIVEFPNWEGIGFMFSLLKIVPLVVRLHTSMIESVETLNRTARLGERFMMWLEKVSARNASAVVTHSDSHRIKYANSYGISTECIEMIPHGLEGSCFAGLNKEHNSKAVLTVGPLNARKGADTLIRAIPIVLAQVPDAEFWIVGRDVNSQYQKKLLESAPTSDLSKVNFFGFVDEKTIQNLYKSCGIYISASVYESFGLTFIEAMAKGKPVIGCRAGAISEIIRDEQNGILVSPNNPQEFAGAIIRLLQNSELRLKLGVNGYELAKEYYSADRMAKDVEAFYRDVVVNKARRIKK